MIFFPTTIHIVGTRQLVHNGNEEMHHSILMLWVKWFYQYQTGTTPTVVGMMFTFFVPNIFYLLLTFYKLAVQNYSLNKKHFLRIIFIIPRGFYLSHAQKKTNYVSNCGLESNKQPPHFCAHFKFMQLSSVVVPLLGITDYDLDVAVIMIKQLIVVLIIDDGVSFSKFTAKY